MRNLLIFVFLYLSLEIYASSDSTSYFQEDDLDKISLFVPNSFSPDGDGINDHLNFRSNSIFTAELMIFNHYGKLVYSTSDYQNGWDGRKNNGWKCETDTYFYLIKGQATDGKPFSKFGEVFLKQ